MRRSIRLRHIPQTSWMWIAIIVLFVGAFVRVFVFYDYNQDVEERIEALETVVAQELAKGP